MTTVKNSMAGFIRLSLTTWMALFVIGTVLIVTAPGNSIRIDHRQPYSIEKIRIVRSGFSLTNFNDRRHRIRRTAILIIFGLAATVAWVFFFGRARYPDALTALVILSFSVTIFSALTVPGTRIRDYLNERKTEKMREAHPAAVKYCRRHTRLVVNTARAAGYSDKWAHRVREATRCMRITFIGKKDYIEVTQKGLKKFVALCDGKYTIRCKRTRRFALLLDRAVKRR